MGHLDRPIPIGYVETVASGRNQIADRDSLALLRGAARSDLSAARMRTASIHSWLRPGRYESLPALLAGEAPVPTFGSGE
jgi:hypothetical protein